MDTDRRAAKDALFEGFALVGKALASGRRLEMLDLLWQGERSVEEVASETGLSVANASHHLRVLAGAGLVSQRRQGTRIFYGLATQTVGDLWSDLRAVAAERVAEVERLAVAYIGEPDPIEPVPREELARRLGSPDLVVLDVRPRPEYEAGHILGARWVDPGHAGRPDGIPDDVEVVAYCRGRYCVLADDAIRRLRDGGCRARRLEDGFPEWRRAGFPVEVTKEAV